VRLRTYRLGLTESDIEPGTVMPHDAETKLVTIGHSGLSANLNSILGSDLPAVVAPVVSAKSGSIVRSKSGSIPARLRIPWRPQIGHVLSGRRASPEEQVVRKLHDGHVRRCPS
jgi:hypothetical protein